MTVNETPPPAPDPRPTQRKRVRSDPEMQPFAMLYLADVAELARSLSLQQLRVFLGLTRQMAYNGPFIYTNKRLCDELGTFQQKVSAAIRDLKDLGFILPVGPEPRRVYLNPKYAWHGTRRGRVIAQLELRRRYPTAGFIADITDEDRAVLEEHPDLPDQEPTPEEDR